MRTEKDKMLSGELYNPFDPQLSAERRHARLLVKKLNDTRDDQVEERKRLIKKLLPSTGESIWIEPPFFCDYGSNITLGDDVFFNFNCVVLDVAPVRIGSRVLFGPAVQVYAATHPLRAAARRAGLPGGQGEGMGSGADKFRDITGVDGTIAMRYAEEMGLGTRDYELQQVD